MESKRRVTGKWDEARSWSCVEPRRSSWSLFTGVGAKNTYTIEENVKGEWRRSLFVGVRGWSWWILVIV
ncbi:hypothetical protein H5410_018155 [Solanum commersonii]|uniref:Uncharacterized protein n=1 Tax=Solanum commersonii TaxID=4109 RepID=A0A9J6A217_SOLCO|nr:hypothetical protein H5410_018155 [Solanum commersonii]